MEDLEIKNIFEFFKNKKVLITGHTGFKGAWFSKLLLIHPLMHNIPSLNQ